MDEPEDVEEQFIPLGISEGHSENYSEYSPGEEEDNDDVAEVVAPPPTRVSDDVASCSSQRQEIDGLYCSICMEPWTNGGDHQVSCLPCGHLYGSRCIKRWLQHCTSPKKCPQCNNKCSLKDVRVIYAPQIVAVDHKLQKKIESLEAKCASLEKKGKDWLYREAEWLKKESDLQRQVRQLTKRTSSLESLLQNMQNRPQVFSNAGFKHAIFNDQESSSKFTLQNVLHVVDARLFDVDASSRVVLIARRLNGMGGMHALTKMSLLAPHEQENIPLPANTKAIRELRVAPDGRLALVAFSGKKLSVISTESNNIVLSYDLPAAGWSCSWDLSSPFYLYTGLQNGMLMVFDMRQTSRPVQSITGLTCNPIHSVHCLSPDSSSPSGVKSLLTASSVGLCQWNFGDMLERPFLVSGSQNQGVCIACAYSPSHNHIVASFRPKIEVGSGDETVSQMSLTPAACVMGQGVQGTHVLFKSLGSRCYEKLGSSYTNVDNIRLPRSAIVDRVDHNAQFACGDELNRELVLHEMPSLVVGQRLKTWKQPIRDIRYTPDMNLLSCLSEDTVQIFTPSA